jgi:uncharacterized protein (DUF4415 family)
LRYIRPIPGLPDTITRQAPLTARAIQPHDVKEKRTGKTSVNERTDWNRLRSLSDHQVRRAIESDPEARPTDPEFWKKARVVIPAARQTITIRLDADLLEWLRKQKGYQTRINAVLRTFMDANLTSRRRG